MKRNKRNMKEQYKIMGIKQRERTNKEVQIRSEKNVNIERISKNEP